MKSFGPNTNIPILLSDIHCTGTESSILQCHHESCRITNCSHANDVGIVCESKYSLT